MTNLYLTNGRKSKKGYIMNSPAKTHRQSASDLAKEALETEKEGNWVRAALTMGAALVQTGLALEQRLTDISHTLKRGS